MDRGTVTNSFRLATKQSGATGTLTVSFTIYFLLLHRHHIYKKTENGRDIELNEVGPRFEMKGEYVKLHKMS